MGVMGNVWEWVIKKARAGWAMATPRNARSSALRPYLAGAMPGLWSSPHLEEAQKFTGWTYCAVTALADQAAQATCAVYLVGRKRRTEDDTGRIRKAASQHQEHHGERIPMRDKHPLVRLLNRPNPEQSGSQFRYQMMQQLALTGTAHVWIIRNGLGTPVELYVVPTAAATPLPPTNDHPRGQYRVSPLASFSGTVGDDYLPPGSLGPLLTAGAILDARDIKSIRLPHPLYRSDGWSPLAAGATVIDVENQLNLARWYSFKNAAAPGMVLELAEDANPAPEEMEALRTDLRNRNSGVQNAGKDLLLPPGVSAKQITSTNKEMDYTTSFPQVRDGVLALHKTPAVAIGVTEAGSYSAFYASLKQFTELAVQPKLDMIAEELTEALASDFERATGLPDDERLVIDMKARAIDDPTLREGRIRTLTAAKAITINEVRAEDGLPPVEWGDCPAGTDPLQWKQGMLQLKQAEQGGPGGGNPLAAMMAGGGGQPGAGQEQEPKPGQGDGKGEDSDPFSELLGDGKGTTGSGAEEDDPFASLFGDAGQDGADAGIGTTDDTPIGDLGKDTDADADDEDTGTPDPVRASAPRIPRLGKSYRLRFDLSHMTPHLNGNGHHRNGRS